LRLCFLPVLAGNVYQRPTFPREDAKVAKTQRKLYFLSKNRIILMELRITKLLPEHWTEVRAVYCDGLRTGQATFETSAPSWEKWDAAHLPHSRLIATSDGQVAGWAALSPVSARAVYAGVAEVSVYVAERWRGKGVGRGLLLALITESENNGIWTLQAGIFPENESSLALHRSCGFREVGRRERIGILNGVWRDTVMLERRSAVAGKEQTAES
jgi:phosphinothricin acetyltransferase